MVMHEVALCKICNKPTFGFKDQDKLCGCPFKEENYDFVEMDIEPECCPCDICGQYHSKDECPMTFTQNTASVPTEKDKLYPVKCFSCGRIHCYCGVEGTIFGYCLDCAIKEQKF